MSIAEPDIRAPIDANGNLTGDGTRGFEWDAANRLRAFDESALRIELKFDGEGRASEMRRFESSVQTLLNLRTWCAAQACQERLDNGASSVRHRFDNGFYDGSSVQFLVRDHLGSIDASVATNGTVIGRSTYDPFGRRSSTSSMPTWLGYGGHDTFGDTDLAFAQYRTYNIADGRWLTRDSLGLIAGPNLYLYVDNDPVSYFDADGLVKIRVGGPWHPPQGVKTKCRPADLCQTIIGKIWLLNRMLMLEGTHVCPLREEEVSTPKTSATYTFSLLNVRSYFSKHVCQMFPLAIKIASINLLWLQSLG